MADTPGETPTGAETDSAKPETGTPPETGETPGDGTQPISPEAYRKVQSEAAKHRREKHELQVRLTELENAKLSETEKTAKRLQEMEEQNARLIRDALEAQVTAKAATARARNPEIVASLIEPDEEDIDKAISRIKRQYPYLFENNGTAGNANGGAHGGSIKQSPDEVMDALIRGGRL